MPVNPFIERHVSEDPQRQYENTTRDLARHFIYNEGQLDIHQIERNIAKAMRIPRLVPIEQSEHQLETLLHLLKGIEAHERANLYHHGAWQSALKKHPQPPETLSRDGVATLFERFEFRNALTDAEKETLEHYEKILALNKQAAIRLSDNIRINHTDIEALTIDIETRVADRNPNTHERIAALAELDRRLADLIHRIPDDERGKRFEMEEVYLLRRLIHAADRGHIASVSHGTPRADLRPDFGSVDIEVAAAGEVIAFQLKTFKRGVSKTTREKQERILEQAHGRLSDTPTQLVVLQAESIQEAYETSLRQPATTRTSRADKYAALEPLIDGLHAHGQRRLLTVLGLTENDLALEAKERMRRQAERVRFEEELRAKTALDAEVAARREAAARLERDFVRVREEALRREREERAAEHERRVTEAARQRQEVEAEAAKKKRDEQEARLAAAAAREAEKRAGEEAAAAAEVEKLRKQLDREAKKKEAGDWPPKTFTKLVSPVILQAHGYLDRAWKGSPSDLLAAKKQFFASYSSNGAEAGKPNATFKKTFPSRDSFEKK